MPKQIRRIIFVISIVALVGVLLFWPKSDQNYTSEKLKIVTTNFASYDLARALTKDLDVDLTMLIKPGTDVHSYDPTPQDIIKIQTTNVFIYVGGESETWVDDINKGSATIIKLSDAVELVDEPEDGILQQEHKEAEKDEHIWTSPVNYQQMLTFAKDKLTEKYPDLSEKISQNYHNYFSELQQIDQNYREVNIKQPIVIADRFPFIYFAKTYQLEYYAAFPGCAEQVEADANTIAKLINIINENEIKTIYTIELSNAKIAQTIADSTGAKIRSIHSGHNLSQEDFENGLTMTEIYRRNLGVLQEEE